MRNLSKKNKFYNSRIYVFFYAISSFPLPTTGFGAYLSGCLSGYLSARHGDVLLDPAHRLRTPYIMVRRSNLARYFRHIDALLTIHIRPLYDQFRAEAECYREYREAGDGSDEFAIQKALNAARLANHIAETSAAADHLQEIYSDRYKARFVMLRSQIADHIGGIHHFNNDAVPKELDSIMLAGNSVLPDGFEKFHVSEMIREMNDFVSLELAR